MRSALLYVAAILAAVGAGQVTLTPTTITRKTSKCAEPWTVTETQTDTETETETVTVAHQAATTTETYVESTTITSTVSYPVTVFSSITATVIQTTTSIFTQPCSKVSCPLVTATGTVCKTCFLPDCTSSSVLPKPCGCDGALATTTVDFPCNDPDSCNNIGCKTAYAFATAEAC